MEQCDYCDQLFDTKEVLYEHGEVHSDTDRNEQITSNQKKLNKS